MPRLTDPQSLNRYAYERNNPVNRIDESGHDDADASGDPAGATGGPGDDGDSPADDSDSPAASPALEGPPAAAFDGTRGYISLVNTITPAPASNEPAGSGGAGNPGDDSGSRGSFGLSTLSDIARAAMAVVARGMGAATRGAAAAIEFGALLRALGPLAPLTFAGDTTPSPPNGGNAANGDPATNVANQSTPATPPSPAPPAPGDPDGPKHGATPKGRPYSAHYTQPDKGPARNIPGSVVDAVIDNTVPHRVSPERVVHYDPNNNATVVVDKGEILSVHKGPPWAGQF